MPTPFPAPVGAATSECTILRAEIGARDFGVQACPRSARAPPRAAAPAARRAAARPARPSGRCRAGQLRPPEQRDAGEGEGDHHPCPDQRRRSDRPCHRAAAGSSRNQVAGRSRAGRRRAARSRRRRRPAGRAGARPSARRRRRAGRPVHAASSPAPIVVVTSPAATRRPGRPASARRRHRHARASHRRELRPPDWSDRPPAGPRRDRGASRACAPLPARRAGPRAPVSRSRSAASR